MHSNSGAWSLYHSAFSNAISPQTTAHKQLARSSSTYPPPINATRRSSPAFEMPAQPKGPTSPQNAFTIAPTPGFNQHETCSTSGGQCVLSCLDDACMNSCVHRYGKYHKFIWVGDADEYIVPKIDYRKILAAESIMYPIEAGKAVAGIARHKLMSILLQEKGTLTVKNVDIGGMETAAIKNQDILWSVGDRICENGPTMDREKSFFFNKSHSGASSTMEIGWE